MYRSTDQRLPLLVYLFVDSLLLLLLLSLLLTLRRRWESHLGLMCTRSRNEGCNRG